MAERQTLTIPEAAELLGVSRGLAYAAARVGDLPTVKLGRRLLVPRARLEDMLGLNGHDPADDRAVVKTVDDGDGYGPD